MTQVDAIYQNGVFKPLQEVGLADNQRVRLSIQPLAADMRAWLAEVQEMQKRHHRGARLLSRQHPGHRRGPQAMSDTVVDSSVVA